jgi:hypothetical protein
MPPEPPKRPRQPSRPDADRISVVDLEPEPDVLAQRRFDRPQRTTLADLPKAAPPERKPTLKGLSPPNPLEKKTWRLPTPPSALANARRTDPPASPAPPATGIRIPDDETPRDGHPGLAAELAELAEFRRRERVQAESRQPGPYQPPLRTQSPVPSSGPAKVDQAIGATMRLLFARYSWPLLAALGVGGAVLKPAADPAKADATLAKLEELTRKVDRVAARQDAALDREPELLDFVECLYEQQREYFEQLLPSQERLITGELRRAWVDRCRSRKPKR